MAGGNLGHAWQFKLKGTLRRLLVKGSTHIFRGTLVAVASDGWAVPASDASGLVFMGVAEEEANNNPGDNGAKSVLVRADGLAVVVKGSATGQSDIGKAVYAAAAHTSSVDGTVALTGTHGVRVGTVISRVTDLPDGDTFAKKYLSVQLEPGAPIDLGS